MLIEIFRPDVADRLGLGYEALEAANPGLVYASITGFGPQGPWANLKGYESVVASVTGVYRSFSGMNPGPLPDHAGHFAPSHVPAVGGPGERRALDAVRAESAASLRVVQRALVLDRMLTDPTWEGIPILEEEAKHEELMQRMLEAGARPNPGRVASGLRGRS